MNYIELINRFWELDEIWQFTCCETRLYFYLVKTANRLGWVDNWIHSIDKLVGNVGVSKNSIKNARNRLSQAGLISFKEGGKGHGNKTRYQILTPKVDPKHDPKHDPKVDPKHDPLYNKTKTETKTISLSTGEQKVICSSLFEVMEKLLGDQGWIEPLCMNNHKTLAEVHDLIKVFFSELQAREDYHKEEREAKDHFAKWLNIQVNKEKKEGGSNARSKGGHGADARPKQYGGY